MANTPSRQLTRRDGKAYSFEDLCGLGADLHDELFHRGVMPEFENLAGWQFKGWNSSLVSAAMGIRRFIKGFWDKGGDWEDCDSIWGYNLWVRQAGRPSDNWIASNSWFPSLPTETPPANPVRHGIYKVLPAKNSPGDHKFPHALLLDYGQGNNPLTHMGRNLRDYMIQVYEDDPTLLLGKAYAAVGKERVLMPGHFMMVRFRRA